MEERREWLLFRGLICRILEEEKNATVAILNHLKEANPSITVL